MNKGFLTDDQDFFNLVRNIANRSIPPEERAIAEAMASEYLWGLNNWERLKDTPHGAYIRECLSVNACPDYGLRALYRKQILEK